MPTRDILTHASTTMPLSNTRSRTSIRLVPPGALSTAICLGPFYRSLKSSTRRESRRCLVVNYGHELKLDLQTFYERFFCFAFCRGALIEESSPLTVAPEAP